MEEIEMTAEEKRLNFVVIREDWSEYRLEDGSIVKVKASISDIIDAGKMKGKLHELKFVFNNVFFKEPSPDDRGTPSDSPKISEEDIIQDLKFEKIREPLNIYDIPEKLVLLVQVKLTDLKKTRKFDFNGNRIYHCGISCAINVVRYPE
jgi:hypothetical protein